MNEFDAALIFETYYLPIREGMARQGQIIGRQQWLQGSFIPIFPTTALPQLVALGLAPLGTQYLVAAAPVNGKHG